MVQEIYLKHKIGGKSYYVRKNQLVATKCWFIDSKCFEHYYAHLQEYISEYRFLVSKPGKI
jgi:hypothetical protein